VRHFPKRLPLHGVGPHGAKNCLHDPNANPASDRSDPHPLLHACPVWQFVPKYPPDAPITNPRAAVPTPGVVQFVHPPLPFTITAPGVGGTTVPADAAGEPATDGSVGAGWARAAPFACGIAIAGVGFWAAADPASTTAANAAAHSRRHIR